MPAFSELLRTYREERRMAQRGLAEASGINQAILSRFETGDRHPARPEQVMVLITALDLDDAQADALLSAAGYWPRVFVDLGPEDPTLHVVAQVLANRRLDGGRKASFRRIVALLAEEWKEL